MGRAVCRRGAQPRTVSGAAASAHIQSHPCDPEVQYQLLSAGGGSCKKMGTRDAFESIVNTSENLKEAFSFRKQEGNVSFCDNCMTRTI